MISPVIEVQTPTPESAPGEPRKAEFLNNPLVRFGPGKHCTLYEDMLFYSAVHECTFVIPSRFKWNLDSVPNLALAKLIAPSTVASRLASGVHDYGYEYKGKMQTIERGEIQLTKTQLDDLYCECLDALGYHDIGIVASRTGVFLGGWWSWWVKPWFAKRRNKS